MSFDLAKTSYDRVTLATLHVETSPDLTIEQWGRVDVVLRECLAAYGVNHVTVAPETTGSDRGSTKSGCVDLHGCSGPIIASE